MKERKVIEIRSDKHTVDAVGIDVLGNISVLYADGQVRQCITEEDIKRDWRASINFR